MSALRRELEILAMAYLTGQASEDQVEAYREAFASDPDFRDIVRELESWLTPLNSDVPDKAPPEGLLDSIMSEIDFAEAEAVEEDMVAPAPANDNSAKWKFMTAAASLVAAFAIASHFVTPTTPPVDPVEQSDPLLALLAGEESPSLVAIIYDPSTNRVVARLNNIAVPTDGDFQLWLIRDGAEAPVSLGVMDSLTPDGRISVNVPEDLRAEGDLLAISLEAKGGSTTNLPQGPVLYTGQISNL